jgi:hypothetical protein
MWQVAAEHHVVYKLALLGFVASLTTSKRASILACSHDGHRVALLRVLTLPAAASVSGEAERHVARNLAYVCVDFGDSERLPRCYVIPSAVAARMPVLTAGLLEPYSEAWHLLGLQDDEKARVAS